VSKQHHHPVGVPSSSLGSKGEKGPALTHRPSFIPMCETCNAWWCRGASSASYSNRAWSPCEPSAAAAVKLEVVPEG
jgi:hypothetical protein